MITVTNNSVQQVNAAILALDKDSDNKVLLLNQKIKEANDAIASINKILDGLNKDANVVSVNGKTGIVTLDASDVGALPDSTHIPSDPVQSDWTETDTNSLAYIKNKPNLATVATSGSYNDLADKPTIRTVKFVDYRWDGTMSAINQQVRIPLSSFGSEVTPSNVLSFMVIYWTGFQAFASADWADTQGLACALVALTTGTGYAKIRCAYFV